MKRLLKAAAALAVSAAIAGPLAAQDFAITNATVAIGDGSEPMENATVVVRAGKRGRRRLGRRRSGRHTGGGRPG